jgi:hypothetical protein
MKAGPKARSGAEVFDRDESVESYLGGYGLYYRTPLVELGIVAPRGEIVPDLNEPLPRDVLRPGLGPTLAEHFRSAIANTAYYQEYFFGAQPIPRAVLEDLAKRACLCRLNDHPLERLTVRDGLLGLPESSRSPGIGIERTMLAEQRRLSFALVLWALDQRSEVPQGNGDPTPGFRRVVWDEFELRLGESSKLAAALAQWAALIAKDYSQDALATIWSEFCRKGYAAQPTDGMLPADIECFLSSDLLQADVLDLTGSSLPVKSGTATKDFMSELSGRLAENSLEDIRGWAIRQGTAVAGLALLLQLRNRLTNQMMEDLQWRAIAGQSSNWQPGLLGMVVALDHHLEEEPILGDTLAWVTQRFVIDVHERVAYSKLPDFTFRFRWEEDRLRFYGLDPKRFEPTDIRLDAISRLSEDLGLLGPGSGQGLLTGDGRAFVAEVLG